MGVEQECLEIVLFFFLFLELCEPFNLSPLEFKQDILLT